MHQDLVDVGAYPRWWRERLRAVYVVDPAAAFMFVWALRRAFYPQWVRREWDQWGRDRFGAGENDAPEEAFEWLLDPDHDVYLAPQRLLYKLIASAPQQAGELLDYLDRYPCYRQERWQYGNVVENALRGHARAAPVPHRAGARPRAHGRRRRHIARATSSADPGDEDPDPEAPPSGGATRGATAG